MDERSLVATCHAIRGVLSRAQKFGTATNYDPVDPGVTHSIPQANGSFKVPGETMDDRQRYMVGRKTSPSTVWTPTRSSACQRYAS